MCGLLTQMKRHISKTKDPKPKQVMSKNYGDNPPLSYNKYLRVQDLIGLQDCLSDPVHHDELLFITVHQAYELWFKQILHEIDAAISLMNQNRLPPATRALVRVVEIEKLLINQIHILESMIPISFLAFRDQLNPASGFQSGVERTRFRQDPVAGRPLAAGFLFLRKGQ